MDVQSSPSRQLAFQPSSANNDIFGRLVDRHQSFPVRHLSVCAFLPPSASPFCTPSAPMPSRKEPIFDSPASPEYSTAPNTPSTSSVRMLLSPPTWISTPPTPPPRLVRRSVTCLARRPSSPVTPSASFPASSSPHAQRSSIPKRRASVPTMSHRPPATDDALVFVESPPTSLASPLVASPLQTTFTALSVDASPVSKTRSRPLFHIPHQVSTDSEDGGLQNVDSPARSIEDTSAEGSCSEHGSDDSRWYSEKNKDSIRKYHALMELLTTEVGYLMDLRALVIVYLRNLPTLSRSTVSSSTFSSFTSNPWASSYTQLHAAPLSFTTLSDSHMSQLSSIAQSKEQAKNFSRYLFTDNEIELLTRNGEEILQLHENFVKELRTVMAPLGYPMEAQVADDLDSSQTDRINKIDVAVGAVSTKFATEASRFNSYQSFCAGHPEALDLVRKTSNQFPVEWDVFEQRCSVMISGLLGTGGDASEAQESLDAPSTPSKPKDRKRTTSLTSIDGAVRTLRSRANGIVPKESMPDLRKDRHSRRLALVDYLIKPIQRICKYPMLLDQLKPGKALRALSSAPPLVRSDVDVIVDSAAQAMRHVATSVDEARHRQDVAIQSSLIVSRLSLANVTVAMSHASTSSHPPYQALTPAFLSSLGTCLLAGSLDVMHHHVLTPPGSTSNIKARYLGAFLYFGGYLVLVKVFKGKVYEPRHWFSLADFDISDVDEEDALLPCSFRLSSGEHQFELAAACQREKVAWLSAIRESLTHSGTWVDEPTPSLRLDGKGELIPSTLDDGPFEVLNTLPTIQSIPELTNSPERTELTETIVVAAVQVETTRHHRRPARIDLSTKLPPLSPSRRSSTASVKAIFSPMGDTETVVIRRSSTSARMQVDQGLHDVISQPCLTARSYASSREEELFQAPKITRAGFARSNSGISMAGMAKNRLSRHESVRVLRRNSLLDGPDMGRAKHSLSKTRSLASRRHVKKLRITSVSEDECNAAGYYRETMSASPSPFSQCSSLANSLPCSTSSSPTPNYMTLPALSPGYIETPPKSSRSLVSGVRGLFHSRSTSPVFFSPNTDQSDKSATDMEQHSPIPSPKATSNSTVKVTLAPGLLRRWARGSLHRRTRSAPDIPENQLPKNAAVLRGNTTPVELLTLDFSAPISLARSPEHDITSAPSSNEKHSRRKSLLSTALATDPDSMPHRITKNISLLQRLKV